MTLTCLRDNETPLGTSQGTRCGASFELADSAATRSSGELCLAAEGQGSVQPVASRGARPPTTGLTRSGPLVAEHPPAERGVPRRRLLARFCAPDWLHTL